jgi:hypothetical protein
MVTGAGVPSTTVRRMRQLFRMAIKSRAATFLVKQRARTRNGSSRSILIVSDGKAMTSEQQLAPLIRHRHAIAARTGLIFEFRQLQQAHSLKVADLKRYDIVGIKLTWNTPPAEAKAIVEALFSAARQAGAKTIVLDGEDDQNILWPDIIAASDTYLKKHRLKDDAEYRKPYLGKSNLTDYASKKYDFSFANDVIPYTSALSQEQIDKITLGWNIALDDKIYDLSRDISPKALDRKRDIDICCRASVSSEKWIYGMRNDAVKAITALSDVRRVHAPRDRVSQQEYYDEMLRARMTVSPFGYGELCWRDFEAILCGSVLVKQDMSHIKTWPNLFVPHETYVPVAWDFSNLENACKPYLDDEAARKKIVCNARNALLQALTADAFIERIERVIR